MQSLGYEVGVIDGTSITSAAAEGLSENVAEGGAAVQPWWRTRKAQPLLTIGTLLALGYLVGQVVPEIGGWAELPAALLGLWSAGRRSIALTRAGSPFSIEMLMSIATAGALVIGAPVEAAVVVFLFTAGEVMEGVAAGRARAGIQALTALVPRTALLVEGVAVRQVSAASVQVGQLVLIRPLDRVPVDGIIIGGASELDESPVTGESVLVAKQEGGTLLAGSMNGSTTLQVRVTRAASDNTIARIVHMAEEAQA